IALYCPVETRIETRIFGSRLKTLWRISCRRSRTVSASGCCLVNYCEAAVMHSPRARVWTHPFDRFNDFVMQLHKRPSTNRLVMHYAIPKTSNGIETIMDSGSRLSAAR